MHEDITDILTLEVKKEMADRYFGFRKLIEEDIREYDNQVLTSFKRLEQQIGFDLVRLYILLKDENLIHEFFQLAGLDQLIFYDPYLAESPTLRQKVFAGQKIRGLTRAGRFKNMIFDTYETLSNDINQYRQNLAKLASERNSIAEEIQLFYHKHDLGVMMDFLRGLDGSGGSQAGDMAGGLAQQSGNTLEEKLKVQPPPPVHELLPDIQPVIPLSRLKDAFKRIVNLAFISQGRPDLKQIVSS
ncbi:MAG TPA: hypothetical protein DDY20_05265 [Desulfobulbaceae bacterium]|nr:hypothetical protein [Desulfobulbaceae bacterium]